MENSGSFQTRCIMYRRRYRRNPSSISLVVAPTREGIVEHPTRGRVIHPPASASPICCTVGCREMRSKTGSEPFLLSLCVGSTPQTDSSVSHMRVGRTTKRTRWNAAVKRADGGYGANITVLS